MTETRTLQVSHTPGPWLTADQAHFGAIEIIGPKGEELADVNTSNGADEPTLYPAWQNARLIAAAPDLLAALKTARECIAYCRKAHKDAQSGTGFPVEKILDAAIAKAEGRDG